MGSIPNGNVKAFMNQMVYSKTKIITSFVMLSRCYTLVTNYASLSKYLSSQYLSCHLTHIAVCKATTILGILPYCSIGNPTEVIHHSI